MNEFILGGMRGERFYVVQENRTEIVIGWNLDYEPNEDNECGYAIKAGPFRTKKEAEQHINGEAA